MAARNAIPIDRLIRLQERLDASGLDALLLFDMKNIRYLTGFTGSEGVCLIWPGHGGVLQVDGRYLTQANEQVKTVEVGLVRDQLADAAKKIRAKNAHTVGFEASAMTFEMYARLRKLLRGVSLKPFGNDIQTLRTVKDKAELALIEQAANVSHRALQKVFPMIQPGVRERDIALELDFQMRKAGAEDISFPTIIASGPRSALPHAEPGMRKVRPGDAVVIDYGAVVKGYHSDETCTIMVGHVGSKIGRLYAIVKEAHDRAIASVRAGVSCREVDGIAREVIAREGFGDFFSHGTGHGVGLDVHEAPRLSPMSDAILEEGMVVTVEPGIYLPGCGGVRIEDMVLVEKSGCRLLTKTSKKLKIIH